MRNENMGWECPKCSRCYAPTVQECSNCIPKELDVNTISHSGSPLVYNPSVGHQAFIVGTGVSNHNSTSNVSRACINFVEVKGNKYCGNCNRPRANHAASSYT